MKRGLKVFILAALMILLMCSVAYASEDSITELDIIAGLEFCNEYPVTLNVDGKHIETDVNPVIIKARTLIPARAVFESMGGAVDWNDEDREVHVSLGESKVNLLVDSKTAYLNGEEKTLDVPAMIIGDRTMIPVRFVAESLDCQVGWDDPSRTVLISSPVIEEPLLISDIRVEDLEDKYRVVMEGDDQLEAYNTFAYDNPDRFGINIKDVQLGMEEGNLDIQNEIFKDIRFSQFDAETVRVVVDLEEKVAGKISMSKDRTSIYIDFGKTQAIDHEKLGDTTVDGLAVLDWRATGKLIIIDPGHGGKDPGAQGRQNGKVVINEKDINLDIALRLNEKLMAAGANTYILREDDTTISLYDRPAMANEANGDLYISIHNNSATSSSANGTETYFYSKSNEADYGIDTKRFATLVHNEIVKALGINDRGVKKELAYAVINRTKMPAIIVEGAFISNPNDLEYMLTDEFRERYAFGAAKGIIQLLNESIEN
ncbi:MAG: N-acetylmuramoyl-L-alanine amidase [Anaerovoracaceae bacterium]|jgi:N-acetylmuramoyl-L-alanine amidase